MRCATELVPAIWDDDMRGRVRFLTLFDSADTPTSTLSVGLAELPEDGWLGLHRHPQVETYHVLDGRGRLEINGAVHDLAPGCSAFIPSNAPHGVRPAPGTRLRLLFAFATDSLSEIEYEWLHAAPR